MSVNGFWDRTMVRYALKLWHRKYGSAPSAEGWRSPSKLEGDWPSTSTVIAAFGSWSAALEAAGLEPNPTGRPRKSEVVHV